MFVRFVFLVLMLAARAQAGVVDSNQILLHYSISKSTFLTGEPIFISVRFVNHTADTVHYQTDDFWRLTITDQDGKVLPRRSPIGIPHYLAQRDKNGARIDPRPMLLPGQSSRVFLRNITDDYGSGEGFHDFYLPIGSYRVSNSVLLSDTLLITIKDPDDSHEFDAMRVLTNAIDNRVEILADYNRMYKFYSQFYKDFSDTRYVERALRQLSSFFPSTTEGWTDSIQQHFARDYILKFPDGGFILEVIPQLKSEFVLPAERDSIAGILQTHINDLPSEVQVNRAKQTLQELQK